LGLRSFLFDIRELLASQQRLVFYVTLCLLIDVVYQAALPLSLKFLIDEAIVPGDRALLLKIVLLMAVSLALASAAMIWRDLLYSRLSAAVLRGIRERLFAHLQGLSAGYFTSMRPGDLLARFTTDLAAVENLVVSALPIVFCATMSLVLLSFALFALNAEMSLVVALLAPLCWIGSRWLLPRAAALSLEALRRDADVLSLVQENLEGQAAVKALGLEAHSLSRVQQRLDIAETAAQRFNFASYLTERLPNIGMLVLHVVILLWGAHLAFDQRISVGTLVAFNGVLLSLSAAVSELTSSAHTLLEAAAGLRRIREVLEQAPSVADPADGRTLARFGEMIRFDDVSFAYGDTPILKNLRLDILAGESVAFVGRSGSGKSTALNLIARFHDVSSGRVLIDGDDVRKFTQLSLRAHMGIVQQDAMLFEGSLRDNIRLGRLDATDAEVEEAARLAEADAFIQALAQGYDTHLGVGGTRLSGGQRQRISIARALLRRPDILLLDEATSALDPATERAINATLESLRLRYTTIRVTHRLEEAATCNRIYVLEAGRLAEQGSHEQLLAAQGLYAKLWRKQQGLSLSDNLEHAAVTAAWLAEWPLFEGADLVLLDEVSRQFVTERAAPGSEIIRQGSPGDRFYILVRGMVAVSRERAGEKTEIAKLREGDAFGEAALLSDAPRNASVQALTDCVLLSLERTRFRHWADRDPAWRGRLEELAER
jgi:ATP-binding cassette, subfamily B, bacterial